MSKRIKLVLTTAALYALFTFLTVTALRMPPRRARRAEARVEPVAIEPVPAIAATTTFWAPDKQLRAVVVDYCPMSYGNGESRVDIHNASGRLLGSRDYSGGGTQGDRVEHAAWTPDSRFFVFSGQSSGGHQPWHHPTHFFARRERKFGWLDALTEGPGITDGQFRIRPPARVTVSVDAPAKVTIDLGRLSAARLREAWRGE